MSTGELEPDLVAAAQYLWYGHRKIRDRSELELCWKGAKAIAAGDGTLSDEEREALVARMTATATPRAVIDAVLRWDPHAQSPADLLARAGLPTRGLSSGGLPSAARELGLWMVYEGVSIGFADGSLALGEIAAAHEVAEAMGVPPTTVDALIALCREEALLRARRIHTLEGRIAVASSRASSSAEYELAPDTVRTVRAVPIEALRPAE